MHPQSENPDVFISYASEDREFAQALAENLVSRGLTVWYDRFVLRLGDRLQQVIDRGLSTSRYGVVILSRSFFKKNWPQRELEGLLARESADGRKVILPVWHQLTFEEVVAYSPIIAGLLAVSTEVGIDSVAEQILDAIEWVPRPTVSAARSIESPDAPVHSATADREAGTRVRAVAVSPAIAQQSAAATAEGFSSHPPIAGKSTRHKNLKRFVGIVLLFASAIIGYRLVRAIVPSSAPEVQQAPISPTGPKPDAPHTELPARSPSPVPSGRGREVTGDSHEAAPADPRNNERQTAQAAQLSAQIPLLRALRERQALGAQILGVVSTGLPDDLWLDRLDFSEQSLHLKGGAVSELSIREYERSLAGACYSSGPTILKAGAKSTPFTVQAACKPQPQGDSDKSLPYAIWTYAPPEEIERQVSSLFSIGEETAEKQVYSRQMAPEQKGVFELRTINMQYANIPYRAVATFFDRLARLPRLVELRTLTMEVADSPARTLVVTLSIAVPVLKKSAMLPAEVNSQPIEAHYVPVPVTDPFRSVVRPEGLRGMLLSEFKANLIGIDNKVFANQISANTVIDGFVHGLVRGDRLFDAEIVNVTAEAVTLQQSVQDTPVSRPTTTTVTISRPAG